MKTNDIVNAIREQVEALYLELDTLEHRLADLELELEETE